MADRQIDSAMTAQVYLFPNALRLKIGIRAKPRNLRIKCPA